VKEIARQVKEISISECKSRSLSAAATSGSDSPPVIAGWIATTADYMACSPPQQRPRAGQSQLEQSGVITPFRRQSKCKNVAEALHPAPRHPASRPEARRHFLAGTGHPYFSTDTTPRCGE